MLISLATIISPLQLRRWRTAKTNIHSAQPKLKSQAFPGHARRYPAPAGTGTQYAKSARSGWEDSGALVTALLAHTHGARRWFIARHDAFLRTVVLSASPAAWVCVDDLMQDVYVHLWRDDFHVLRQWQREHPLQAYLRTVVTRLVWDRLNRLQPVWEELEADPWMAAGARLEQTDVSPTPEEQVAANELSRMMGSALGRLKVGYRQVLELRYFRELSYHEIAVVTGITPTNAGVRITRALAQQKETLPPQLIDDFDVSSSDVRVARAGRNKVGGSSLIQNEQGRNAW